VGGQPASAWPSRASARWESEGLVVPLNAGKPAGGKGPWFWVLWKKARVRRLGNLQTPEKIRNLQTKLYHKAKSEPEYRFYLLYDKVYRLDVLRHAYALARSNAGAAGPDGQTSDGPDPEPEEDARCRELAGSFNFLGYTFGVCHAVGTGRQYLGAKPSKKAQERVYGRVQDLLHSGNMSPRDDVTKRLNQTLNGWANYFSYGTISRAYCRLDYLVNQRFRRWLCRRHKVVGKGTRRFPDSELYAPRGHLALVCLGKALSHRRRLHACGDSSPRAGCGKSARPVR